MEKVLYSEGGEALEQIAQRCPFPGDFQGEAGLGSEQVEQGLIQPHLGTGASTTSLGNLLQCLTTLTVKDFFLISNLNL